MTNRYKNTDSKYAREFVEETKGISCESLL